MENIVSLRSIISFPQWLSGKESTCSLGDVGLIPGSGRSPAERNGKHSHILIWRNPRTEDPGRLQFTELQQSSMTKHLNHNYRIKHATVC